MSNNGCNGDGIHLCLLGIRTGGQDRRSLRSHQNAGILKRNGMNNRLVYKVSGMNIREQKNI